MSALRACDNAVRADNDVAVKVRINFESRENNEIELVHDRALVERVSVLACANTEMASLLHVFDSIKVEVLSIEEAVNLVIVQEVAHRLRQAAYAESHTNTALFHHLCKRNRRRNRRTADTSLIREPVLEIRRVHHELCAVIRHHQFTHIFGRLCSTRCNLRWVSDFVHYNHIIDLCHRNVRREVRERHERVCNRNDFISIIAVNHCVRENAAV